MIELLLWLKSQNPMKNPMPSKGQSLITGQEILAPVLLFDGDCMFCSRWVQFVIANEKSPFLLFSPLDSSYAKYLLKKHGLDPTKLDSVVLIEGKQAFTHSDAVIEILKYLKPPLNLMRNLQVVPQSWRNKVYRLVARNRYRFNSLITHCAYPSTDLKDRFRVDVSDPSHH
jgi:predicted DCC family thiol-disulfide oxidoreductase YuxK